MLNFPAAQGLKLVAVKRPNRPPCDHTSLLFVITVVKYSLDELSWCRL